MRHMRCPVCTKCVRARGVEVPFVVQSAGVTDNFVQVAAHSPNTSPLISLILDPAVGLRILAGDLHGQLTAKPLGLDFRGS